MKVFISWSKPTSLKVAEAIAEWLGDIVDGVEPWISKDIRKGERWSAEIAKTLEECKVGIFCVTPDNYNEPWLLFEAGAVAKTPDALACTFFFRITPTDIDNPLTQFQATQFGDDDAKNKADLLELAKTINRLQGNTDESRLDRRFAKFWTDLEKKLRAISTDDHTEGPHRTDRQLLEEILERVRAQDPDDDFMRRHRSQWLAALHESPERLRVYSFSVENISAGTSVALRKRLQDYFGETANLSREGSRYIYTYASTIGPTATRKALHEQIFPMLSGDAVIESEV